MTVDTTTKTLEQPSLQVNYLEGLNPEQIEAVMAPLDCPLKILAGAGTGKTELISRRFIKLTEDLQKQGVPHPATRILVLTFTNDAANSMKKRVQARLAEYTTQDTDLSGQALWIGTFHQFCMRLLTPYAAQVGLAPQFTLIDTIEQTEMLQSLADRILAGQINPDTGRDLRHSVSGVSPDILSPRVLQTIDQDCLKSLLTGPALLRIIGRIKSTGWTPETFYQEAIRQSEQLTAQLQALPLGDNPDWKAIDRIQGLLESWVQHFTQWADGAWNPVLTAEQDAEKAGKNLTASSYKSQLPEFVTFFLEQRTYKPKTLDTQGLQGILTTERIIIQTLTAIYGLYQETLLQKNACDFDDLINHTLALLRQHKTIRGYYQEQFKAIIVDEFQDSNGSQLALLQLLVQSGSRNLTVVGDTKQSIYGFRFAQPENLDLVFAESPEPRVIHLQTNYRSYPSVLALANTITQVIAPSQPGELLVPCAAWQHVNKAAVRWILLEEGSETTELAEPTAASIKKQPVGIETYKTLEANRLVEEITQNVTAHQWQYNDIAILVSSHQKAERIFSALMQAGIPAVRQKSLDFFAEPIIKDAMALIRLMCFPGDTLSLVRLLQKKLSHRQLKELMHAYQLWKKNDSPNRVVLSDALEEVRQYQSRFLLTFCQQLDAYQEVLPSFSKTYLVALQQFSSQLNHWAGLRHKTHPVKLFQQLVHVSGIANSFSSKENPPWQQAQKQVNLETFEKLLALLSKKLGTTGYNLHHVLQKMEGYKKHPEQPLPVQASLENANAVKIMTVYASKGLEFPVVLIAACEKVMSSRGAHDTVLFDPQFGQKAGFGLMLGKLKGQVNLKRHLYRKAWQKPQEERELLRLFYVAVTRAKHHLSIFYCPDSAEWIHPDYYTGLT